MKYFTFQPNNKKPNIEKEIKKMNKVVIDTQAKMIAQLDYVADLFEAVEDELGVYGILESLLQALDIHQLEDFEEHFNRMHCENIKISAFDFEDQHGIILNELYAWYDKDELQDDLEYIIRMEDLDIEVEENN